MIDLPLLAAVAATILAAPPSSSPLPPITNSQAATPRTPVTSAAITSVSTTAVVSKYPTESLGPQTFTNSNGTPTAVVVPATTNGIAWPSPITDAPVLPSSLTSVIHNTSWFSTPSESRAAPTMVLPLTTAPTILNATLTLPHGNPTSTLVESTSTHKASTATSVSASASSSNAAEVDRSSLPFVLGMLAAVVGFAA